MNAPNQQSEPFSDLEQATDRLFDRELTTDERQALSAELSKDPQALERFRQTTEALLALREPIETPDVTQAVLARLDERPGFITRRTRRIITTGRLAVAAALLGAGAGVVLLENESDSHTSTIAIQKPSSIDAVIAQLHDKDLAAREIEALQAENFFGNQLLDTRNSLSLDASDLDATLTSPLGFLQESLLSTSVLDAETSFSSFRDIRSQEFLFTDPLPDSWPWIASFVPDLEWQGSSLRPKPSRVNPLLEWSPLEFSLPTGPLDRDSKDPLMAPAKLDPGKFKSEKPELKAKDPPHDSG